MGGLPQLQNSYGAWEAYVYEMDAYIIIGSAAAVRARSLLALYSVLLHRGLQCGSGKIIDYEQVQPRNNGD